MKIRWLRVEDQWTSPADQSRVSISIWNALWEITEKNPRFITLNVEIPIEFSLVTL